jgi:hypothetical protein
METKKGGFIPLYTWMMEDYDLSLTDAAIYALIYSFSRDDQGCYFGSIRYIVDTCKVSESTAKRSLKALEEKGLLRKWQETVGNVTVNRYTALCPETCASNPGQNDTPVKMDPVQNDHYTPVKMNSTPVQNEPQIRKREKNYNTPRAGAREEPSSLTVAEVFDEFSRGAPGGLYDALMDFDQHRQALAKKDKKKLWSPLVAKKICKSIKRLVDEAGVKDRAGYAIAMLNQSVENGWTGVFAVKDFVDKTPAAVHIAQPAPDKPRKITKDTTLADLLGGVGA